MSVILSKVGLCFVLLYTAGALGAVASHAGMNAPFFVFLFPWSLGMAGYGDRLILLPFIIINGVAVYAIAATYDLRYQKRLKQVVIE